MIAICPIVELEFLFSARSLADRLEKQRLMHDLFGWVPMHEGIYERAGEIQQVLTETGMHRSADPVDLLIAATAERARLIVLCDDRDYRNVATVTGQPRLLPRLPAAAALAAGLLDLVSRRDPAQPGAAEPCPMCA